MRFKHTVMMNRVCSLLIWAILVGWPASPFPLADDEGLVGPATPLIQPATVETVTIPGDYGAVKERYTPSGTPNLHRLVIHIQDAHANYEGQKNLANIVEHLIQRHGLEVICVEGGSTDKDLSYMRAWSSREERERIAEESLREGLISGEEYIDIAREYPLKFQGVEQPELYEANMQTFLKIDEILVAGRSTIVSLRQVVDDLKLRLYPKPLREVEDQYQAFEENKLAMTKFVPVLIKVAGQKVDLWESLDGKKVKRPKRAQWQGRLADGLQEANARLQARIKEKSWRGQWALRIQPVVERLAQWIQPPVDESLLSGEIRYRYPNLLSLAEALAIEDRLNFRAVEEERNAVIEQLSKLLSKTQLHQLMQKSLAFKMGEVSQVTYYTALEELARSAKLDLARSPHLGRYLFYLRLNANVKAEELFDELGRVMEATRQASLTEPDQRQLYEIDQDLRLVSDFLELKISPEKFQKYQQRGERIAPHFWMGQLRELANRHKVRATIPSDTAILDEHLPTMVEFYLVSQKRDWAFMENTLAKLSKERAHAGILITGGFHTPNLLRLFRERGVSYVVIAPKILEPTDPEFYRKTLKRSWGLEPSPETAPALIPTPQQ